MESKELKKELAQARAQDLRLILMATIGLGLFWVLFGKDSGRSYQSSSTSIGTLVPQGTIHYRAGRSLEWNELDGESPVYERDSIFTPEGSKAYIELTDGTTLDLQSNSLVKLIDLGSKTNQVGIVLGNSKPFDAESFSRMIYACSKKPEARNPLNLEALDEIPVLTRATPKLLPTRKVAEAITKPLDQLSHYNLHLKSPPDKSSLPRTSLWVDFTWSTIPLPGVKYSLEVSRFKNFSAKIGSNDAASGQLLLVNLPGTYYARVTASLKGQTIQSKINEFKMQKVSLAPNSAK